MVTLFIPNVVGRFRLVLSDQSHGHIRNRISPHVIPESQSALIIRRRWINVLARKHGCFAGRSRRRRLDIHVPSARISNRVIVIGSRFVSERKPLHSRPIEIVRSNVLPSALVLFKIAIADDDRTTFLVAAVAAIVFVVAAQIRRDAFVVVAREFVSQASIDEQRFAIREGDVVESHIRRRRVARRRVAVFAEENEFEIVSLADHHFGVVPLVALVVVLAPQVHETRAEFENDAEHSDRRAIVAVHVIPERYLAVWTRTRYGLRYEPHVSSVEGAVERVGVDVPAFVGAEGVID